MWVGPLRRLSMEELMLLNCGVREDSWESLGLQDQISQSWGKSVLNIHWKDWCWSPKSLATWCKELTHWKRPWCWERLKAGGEGDDREQDGWWHHRLNGHEQAPGDDEGQGSLACCSPGGHKDYDRTEQLNNNNNTSVSLYWKTLKNSNHFVA